MTINISYEYNKLRVYRPWVLARLWIPFYKTFNWTYNRDYLEQYIPDLKDGKDTRDGFAVKFIGVIGGFLANKNEDIVDFRLRQLVLADKGTYRGDIVTDSFGRFALIAYLCMSHGKIIPALNIDIEAKNTVLKNAQGQLQTVKDSHLKVNLVKDFLEYNRRQMKVYQLKHNPGESYFQGFKTPNAYITKLFRWCKNKLRPMFHYANKNNIATTRFEYIKNQAKCIGMLYMAFTLLLIIAIVVLALHIAAMPLAPIFGLVNLGFEKKFGLKRAERRLDQIKYKIEHNIFVRHKLGLFKKDKKRVIYRKWLQTPQSDKGFAVLPQELKEHVASFWFSKNANLKMQEAVSKGDKDLSKFESKMVNNSYMRACDKLFSKAQPKETERNMP